MPMNRREIIAALAAAGMGCLAPVQGYAAQGQTCSEIGIIQPRQKTIPDSAGKRQDFQYRLGRAVLDLVQDWYGSGNLPVWNRPLSQIDLEKRVVNIVYWVMRSVSEQENIHPVDPVWVMAQMLEESCFYEFAVSWAFAVGICQFMSATARSVGMVCPENSKLPRSALKRQDLASSLGHLQDLQQKRRDLIDLDPDLFRDPQAKLQGILKTLAQGREYAHSEQDLSRLEQKEKLDEAISQARSGYRTFLRANYQDRSIFDSKDLEFLFRFDQRVTYKKPIAGMVQIMAENLRAREGNLLAATAAYNAGLSRTYTGRQGYKPYGRIPPFRETVAYISRIVVNHHELAGRM